MLQQTLYGVFVVPAILGLVEVLKEVGMPVRAAPAAAVVFGVLASLVQIYGAHWPWSQAVVMGVALGLSSSGLYSGGQTVIGKPRKIVRLREKKPSAP